VVTSKVNKEKLAFPSSLNLACKNNGSKNSLHLLLLLIRRLKTFSLFAKSSLEITDLDDGEAVYYTRMFSDSYIKT
jgi:hypothetical protein